VVDARLSFASDIGIAALEQRQRRLADAQKWDGRPARRAMRRPCHSEVFLELAGGGVDVVDDQGDITELFSVHFRL
jgi:hypothetical protein